MLAQLTTLKTRLGITDTTDDTLLTNLIKFASGRFDRECNRSFERAANATERIHLMADILAKRTTADWLSRLDAADVPCAPVLRRGEVMSNEQVVARELRNDGYAVWQK